MDISPKHLILASVDKSDWKMMSAHKIKVGDEVKVQGGSAQVLSVKEIKALGAYNPFTFSGTIVVNECQASNYVSYFNDDQLVIGNDIKIAVDWQWLAHAFLLPLRWFGTMIVVPLKMDILWFLPDYFVHIQEPIVIFILSFPAPIILPFVLCFIAALGVMVLVESIVLVIAGSPNLVTVATILAGFAHLRHQWETYGSKS